MASGLEKARDGVALVGELIKLAGDDQRVKDAAGQLAEASLTISKAINNVLLPLAAINFAFDKAKKYFSERFAQDLSDKAKKIPGEFLVDPKLSIAGGALQGLAFVHEDAALRELFLNLIATSMDSRKSRDAHPAFVEVIKQLDSQEAQFLIDFLVSSSSPLGPIASLRKKEGGGYVDIKRHVLNFIDSQTGLPQEVPGMTLMVENWVRLGLVEIQYGPVLGGGVKYDWIESRPEFLSAKQDSAHRKKIYWEKGFIRVTDFGMSFSRAIGIDRCAAEN